jgi:beta-galactosidase GanA
MTAEHEPGEEYVGPADVLADEPMEAVEVAVRLRGHFQPIDGRFHWYGRIDASDALTERHRSGSQVVLRTPHGTAVGKIADIDPWGRFRITGLGAPPF